MVQYSDQAKRFRTDQYHRLTDSQWQDIAIFFKDGYKEAVLKLIPADAIRLFLL